MIAEIRKLWEHAQWADRQLLAALRESGGRPAEALREFGHVIGTAETWLARFEHRTPRLAVWPPLTLAEAEAASELVHAGYETRLAQLAAAELEWLVTYVNSAGQSFQNSVGDILLHATLHGQYHRGKVNLLLRQAGHSPAPTDYIAFIRGAPAAITPPGR